MAICTSCNADISDNHAFCTKCGVMMGDKTAAPSDTEQPSGPQRRPTLAFPAAGGSAKNANNLSLWGYFVKCLKKYISFDGRARRKEFWGFYLFSVIFSWGVSTVCLVIAGPSLFEHLSAALENDLITDRAWMMAFQAQVSRAMQPVNLYWLAMLLPFVAVTSRRFHDIGKSGLWIVYFMLIAVGGMVLGALLVGVGGGINIQGGNPSSLVFILAGVLVMAGAWGGTFVWGLVWLCRDSQMGENKYGVYPKS